MGLSEKAAKSKQPAVKKSIIQWLEELDNQGDELAIGWEGGKK
jgi:hypothetical protein